MTEVFTDVSAIGSIIGGLIGGVFTYLAVILTFSREKKREYPSKLLLLTEMIYLIEDYEKNLSLLLNRLYGNPGSPTSLFGDAELDKLRSRILLKSLSVDSETYQLVRDTFSNYFQSGYSDVTAFEQDYSKNIDAGESLEKELPILKGKLSDRISYYEKKLK